MADCADLVGLLLVRPQSEESVWRTVSALANPRIEPLLSAPESSVDSKTWLGMHVGVVEQLNGALHLAPQTSWFACNAWESMLTLVKDYSSRPVMTAEGGLGEGMRRRVICIRGADGLPKSVQHALRTLVERTAASALFVLVTESQSCLDVSLRSRLTSIRPVTLARLLRVRFTPPDVGAGSEATRRGAQALAKGALDEGESLARLADVEHSLAVLEKKGAVVGAAACAVVDRVWKRALSRV